MKLAERLANRLQQLMAMSDNAHDEEDLRLAKKLEKAINAERARANSQAWPNTAAICMQLGIKQTNANPAAPQRSVILFPGGKDNQ